MAEGSIIEQALGVDENDVELSREEARIGAAQTAESISMALAVDAARHDPVLAAQARDYLERQTRLADLHLLHFDGDRLLNDRERELAIGAAKRKQFADRIRYVLQAALALVVIVVGAGFVFMVLSAVRSRNVVVESFQTPPALVSQGVNGKVVATALLDALLKLQTATRSSDKALVSQSAWSTDIKIEVPETGISIGDIDRLLHERLGHDVHIDGDLIQTPDGLALTVRGEGAPAKTIHGQLGDLDKMITAAAEYVYSRSQPTRFASYLTGSGRNQDALDFLPGAFARATDDTTRAALANSWGNAYGGLLMVRDQEAKYRLALTIQKNNWAARSNLIGVIAQTQGEQAAWLESKRFLALAAAAPKGEKPPIRLMHRAAIYTTDLPLVLAAQTDQGRLNGGAGVSKFAAAPVIADAYGAVHDYAQAARYMAASDPNDIFAKTEALLLQAYPAFDRDDPAAAFPAMAAFWTLWTATPDLQEDLNSPCLVAMAYGFAGRRAEAEAIFKQAGAAQLCYAAHGDLLDFEGDLPGAERLWAEGIAKGPNLPQVYLHRGLSALRRGDFKRAEADLAAASRNAPHWADPRKALGDLRARQGRWSEALAHYDEARKYAPAWIQLNAARQTAARQTAAQAAPKPAR